MNLPSAKTKGIFYILAKFLSFLTTGVVNSQGLRFVLKMGKHIMTFEENLIFLKIAVSRWKQTKFIFTWKRSWPPNFPFSWIRTELPTLSGFHACIQKFSIKTVFLHFNLQNEWNPSFTRSMVKMAIERFLRRRYSFEGSNENNDILNKLKK